MPKNTAFFIVIAMMASAALLFTFKSGGDIYRFWRLDKKVPIEALSFSTKKISEDNYILVAHYRYQSYDHVEDLNDTIYKNPFAAESGALTRFKEIRTVWIDSSDPAISSIHNEISYKEFYYMLILWGLTFYFVILSRLTP